MESDLQARDRIGVQDFVLLEDFKSEDAFLDNLRKRYNSGLIYVSIERRENLLNYTKVWFDSRGAHLQRASHSTLHSRTELDSSTRFFLSLSAIIICIWNPILVSVPKCCSNCKYFPLLSCFRQLYNWQSLLTFSSTINQQKLITWTHSDSFCELLLCVSVIIRCILFSSTDLHRNSGCFRKPLQDSSNLQSRSYRKVPRGKSLRTPTPRVS